MFVVTGVALAGQLDPPGPPAPTMKTLVEVEPRILINATNTPGDSGYMFIISQSGSYYLGTNVLQDGNKSGVRVAADDVTIDLNGFSLIGRGADGVTAYGIGSNVPHPNHVTVRNGSVIDWYGDGVILMGEQGIVESVRVEGAHSCGICIASGAIRSCSVRDTKNPEFQNGSAIYAGRASEIVDSIAEGNVANGIQVEFRSTIVRCTSSTNGGDGIYLGHGDQNRVVENNLANNTRNGIWADNDCTRNLIADNHVTGNGTGIRVDGTATGNVIVRNTASQNTTNYVIATPANDAGPIQSAASATSPLANVSAP